MREIKFRQFIGGKMSHWGFIEGGFLGPSANGANSENAQNTPQMEYTGLKDRNGKEIYEGDILGKARSSAKMQEKYGSWKRAVEWGGVDNESGLVGVGFPFYDGTWEVIGNIYENPELLA